MSSSSATFLGHYEALVASGAIEPDAAQREVAEAFGDLERRLSGYKPHRKQGLLGRLFADKDEPPPRGLYVHGEVGRGKTMLMDLCFQASPVEHKRRAHFHEFMAEVHERIYGFRQDIARGQIPDGDVMALTAAAIFEQAWLLCFDEFSRHGHRRCHDPGPVVRAPVRTRHGGGGDIQRGARRSL